MIWYDSANMSRLALINIVWRNKLKNTSILSKGQSSPDNNDSYKTIPWTEFNKLAVKKSWETAVAWKHVCSFKSDFHPLWGWRQFWTRVVSSLEQKSIPWTEFKKLAVKNLGKLQLHESMNALSNRILTHCGAGDNSEHVLSLLLNRK